MHSMKSYLFFFFFLATAFVSAKEVAIEKRENHHVFLECAGTSMFWSLNYEFQMLRYESFQFKPRVGFSFMNAFDFERKFNPNWTIPISFNCTYGRRNHHVEVGSSITASLNYFYNVNSKVKDYEWNVSSGFIAGYRYQNPDKKMVYRVFYSPIWEYFQHYRHWGGASVGFKF